MTTSKFATIHGGLLARKGEAAPAIRHDDPRVTYADAPKPTPIPAPAPVAPPRLEVPMPPVAQSVAPRTEPRPDREFCAKVVMRPARSEAGSGKRDASGGRLSVRLSGRQKNLVRIATAVLGRSQQQLLSEALDDHLVSLATGELRTCTCFNDQLRRRGDAED